MAASTPTFEDEGIGAGGTDPGLQHVASMSSLMSADAIKNSSPFDSSSTSKLYLDQFQLLQRIQATNYSCSRLAKLKSSELVKPALWGTMVTVRSVSKVGLHAANEYALLSAEVVNHLRVQAHPFIQGFYASFVDRTAVHLVHEFCPGGDLAALVEEAAERGHGMGAASVKIFAAEIVLALDDIHSQSIIFRNLNPDNVLLDAGGHARLTNFSFSKRVPEGGRTVTQCGTEDYLAPEILQNQGYHSAVDWWAFGVMLFEMVCGYRPYASNSKQDLLAEVIIRNQPRWPSSIGPQLRSLLEHLLCSDPNVG